MKSLNTVIFSFCSLLAAHVTEFYAKWLAVSEMFGFLFNAVVASFVMMIKTGDFHANQSYRRAQTMSHVTLYIG